MAGHAEAPSGGAKLQEVSLQVDEVKSVMVDNINKVLDNADSLSVVETKSEGLRLGAQTFQRQATEVKNILWWRNFKVKCMVGLVVAAVLCYIIVPILVKQ